MCVGYSGVDMREQVGDYCCTRDHTLVSGATLGNACGCMSMYMVVYVCVCVCRYDGFSQRFRIAEWAHLYVCVSQGGVYMCVFGVKVCVLWVLCVCTCVCMCVSFLNSRNQC